MRFHNIHSIMAGKMMVHLGYAISSEEHRPNDIIKHAQRAEAAGFGFALISDHFHPWLDQQGQSPFVWSVIGGIAHATKHLRLGTGVTCPTVRIHPAILAQATATTAAMMPERFFFGVGTGENLNEHILGDHWHPFEKRAEMLEEAIQLIRELWRGENTTHYGKHYMVENARLYTLPDVPPPIMIAASGEKMARLAGRISDGLISTSPEPKVVEAFESDCEVSRPHYGKLTVCCHPDEAEARKIAHKWWANTGLHGELGQELATPAHFEQAVKNVTEDDVANELICGNDPEKHKQKIRDFIQAGFDHVYIHQVGPDQDTFFKFYEREVMPAFL
jgi:coenzyme F420-dependent glucose-6-phosphate dehydrogenase